MNRALALIALGLAAGSAPLAAQSLRTITSTRQRSDEKELNVNVEFAAGTFRLSKETGGALYRSKITYDEERFRPISTYGKGDLSLGLKSLSVGSHFNGDEHQPQTMTVSVSPDVPARLTLQLVAGESHLELGGLNLTRADIKTGASDSHVAFSTPTTGKCESLSFHVGAAQFTGEHLGNARCRDIELLGGVGDLTMDFTGDWGTTAAVNGNIKVGVGSLKLELPKDIGVQIDVNRVLSSFDPEGFLKNGNSYFSRNWKSAAKRLHLDLTTALGSIEVAWQ
jgi:hypothetical protein